MEITKEQKQQIRTCIIDDLKLRQGFDKSYTQVSHANYLAINVSAHNRIVNGDIEKVLSVSEWVRVAKRLYVDINNIDWKIGNTETFQFVTAQLDACQEQSLSAMNMDLVGIGKTTGAVHHARTHMNAIYTKCRPGITRANLIRSLAMNLGLASHGKIDDVRERVNIHLTGLKKPLIILDDAGYMNDNCWMEVKGIYDEQEYECGWYIIGDDSLRKKIERFLQNDRLGWAAFFDRFGGKFQGVMNTYGETEQIVRRRDQLEVVLNVNGPRHMSKEERTKIITASKLSLRALRKEINKLRSASLFKKAA